MTGELTPASLRALLPPYVVDAIIHVTAPFEAAGTASAPAASTRSVAEDFEPADAVDEGNHE